MKRKKSSGYRRHGGHIGSYLIPSLVAKGYEVVVFSRGKTAAYPEGFWEKR